jgi:hypothetical protein
LRRLKLAAIRRISPDVLITAKTQRWTSDEVLLILVETELAARDASNVVNRLKGRRLPGHQDTRVVPRRHNLEINPRADDCYPAINEDFLLAIDTGST